MGVMSGLDSDQIRHAILTAQSKGYRQVRIRLGEDRFSAVLGNGANGEAEAEAETVVAAEQPSGAVEQAVSSPAVGYFRSTEPLVKVGDIVKEGDKVGEVVALGLANDVTAKQGGEVAEVCVVDGDAVEFGQRILLLRG
jgi:biotin carboxyl carrier protein